MGAGLGWGCGLAEDDVASSGGELGQTGSFVDHIVVVYQVERFRLVVIPQSRHDIRHDEVGTVLRHELQHEYTVLSEVVFRERFGHAQLAFGLSVQSFHDQQVGLNVPQPRVAEHQRPRPADERHRCRRGYEYHPEPQKDVDLLVEQIDGQHALNGVRVHGAHLTYTEVAQRDSRERLRRHPIVSGYQVDEDRQTVHVVFHAEESAQHVQLAYHVDHVQRLGA